MADEWFPLGSPLTGTSHGRTIVNDATVFRRSITHAGARRPTSEQLVTETLNLASGLGSSRQVRNNALTSCNGTSVRLWLCMVDRVADVVVDDLRRRVVPMRGDADPVVVLMVQEARPILVDAIAQRISVRFGRDVATLFVTQTPDAVLANAEPARCDDGRPPARYRCEYGNALIATAPLSPIAGVNFTHAPENRMFVAATVPVGSEAVAVGTYHAQIDAPGREGHQAEERRILEMLAPSLTGTVIIGGDFNNRGFALDGFEKHGSFLAPVDAFVVRNVRSTRLGTWHARTLTAVPYELDHRRVAYKWQRRC
jgi:hypothetical protein